ncbi:MAG: L-threonylcarbamoyladenylate synthase, partial [Candidatus Heimdallarchaeota archaeon]|nr:L-threonylcarbamoyladenylate synthase [Candidatus Heimdallarchaeota archaeon]
ENQINVVELVSMLSEHKIMLYPTDTVAGIGCVGTDQIAVEKVFNIKRRSTNKPVSYAFSSFEMISHYAYVPDEVMRIKHLFPGGITLILRRKPSAPLLFGLDLDTIGVRIPDVPWLIEVIRVLNKPIVTTSANLSGDKPILELGEFSGDIISELDILIEWDRNLGGQSSTVISLVDEVKVLREGLVDGRLLLDLLTDNS